MKRKVLSVLLALVMLLSTLPLSVFASAEGFALDGTSELSVTIKQTITVVDDTDDTPTFTAYLASDAEGIKKLTDIKLTSEADGKTYTGLVSGLRNETYYLCVDGDYHVPYIQGIAFNGKRANVTIYNDDSVNVVDESGETKVLFGVMPCGDMNNDQIINDVDANWMVDAITAFEKAGQKIDQMDPEYKKFDVNNDKEINLTDLSYVVRNNTAVTPVTLAPVVMTASAVVLTQHASAKVDEKTKAEIPGVDASASDTEKAKALSNALLSANTEPTAEGAKESAVKLAPAAEDAVISPENPVSVELALVDNSGEDGKESEPPAPVEALTIVPPVNSESKITSGTMIVVGIPEGSDQEEEITVPFGTQPEPATILLRADKASGAIENNGTVVIDLGKRVAIKKVTINITGTSGNNNLAEIAKVEFFDNFADRIAEPQLSIPTIKENEITCTSGEHKELTVTWDRQPNVSGYELSISGPAVTTVRYTDVPTYTYVSDDFNGNLKGFATYELKVRSVSGDWRSDWSTPLQYEIIPKDAPPKTEYVKAESGITSLSVSWRELWDTEWYTVAYRKATIDNSAEWTELPNHKGNSIVLSGLLGGQEYDVRIKSHNRNGESPWSVTVRGMATTASAVQMPEMDLLNTVSATGRYDNGIQKITGSAINSNYTITNGDSTISPNAYNYDITKEMTDGDPTSYITIPDWDQGYVYANFRAPVIYLNKPTKLDTIRLGASEVAGTVHVSSAKFAYKNTKNGDVSTKDINCSVAQKYDAQGRRYYELVAEEPIMADYIEVRTTCGYGNPQRFNEIRVYNYNSLLDEVDDLFTDYFQIELKPEVTHEMIEALRVRANTQDEKTGEYHYAKDLILKTLEYADQLLDHNTGLDPQIKIDNTISLRQDGHLDFAQTLSDYQPLGYVASYGDTVIIYVGSKTEARGANTSLDLYVTQYHPEVSSWTQKVQTLKVGRNEITIPRLNTTADKEHGGALYVAETANAGSKEYSVRVQYAQKIPMLEVKNLTGEERTAAIKAYVEELNEYVPQLETLHNDYNETLKYDKVTSYKPTECILNSTEIGMKYMFYSVAADQILAGIKNDAKAWCDGKDDIDSQAKALELAIEGMEQEINLFYQMRGLNAGQSSSSTNRFPLTRLNVRYHQMFTGAFMYAGGKHIGIEYGSVAGVLGCKPVEFNEQTGAKENDGYYTGWGLCHEIGHCINSTKYQRGEVTNNVFAQLAMTDETNKTFRAATYIGQSEEDLIKEKGGEEQGKAAYAEQVADKDNYTYEKVYKAVATGKTGHTGDLGVQLAYYWQIHLAYDQTKHSNMIYASDEQGFKDQQENLIYARIDSYMRNPANAAIVTNQDKIDEAKAERAQQDKDGTIPEAERTKIPAAEKIELKLDSDTDNNFMRAVCAAAKTDLLDFFRAWGFTPNSETVAYAQQVGAYYKSKGETSEKETRLIQYIDDNSRLAVLNGENVNMSEGTTVVATIEADGYNAESNPRTTSNEVTLNLSVSGNSNSGSIHGYEIKRDGKVVAFVTADKQDKATYTDILATENNKAFVYSVVAVDEGLHASESVNLPEIKVSHEGLLDKSEWTGESSTYSEQDVKEVKREDNALTHEASTYGSTVGLAFDNNKDTAFEAVPGILSIDEKNGVQQTPMFGWPFSITLNLNKPEQVSAIGLNIANPEDVTNYMVEVSMDGETWETVKFGTLKDSDIKASIDGLYEKAFFNKMLDDGTMDPFMYTYDAMFVRITLTPDPEAAVVRIKEIAIYGPTGDNVELDKVGKLEQDYYYLEEGVEGHDEAFFSKDNYIFTGTFKGDPAYNVVLLKDQKGNYINGSQVIFAEVPKEGPLGETEEGIWVYEVAPEALKQAQAFDANGPVGAPYEVTEVKAELYRVMDAINMTGQRLTSTSLTLKSVDTLKDSTKIELTSTITPEQAGLDTASIALDDQLLKVKSEGALLTVNRSDEVVTAEPTVDVSAPIALSAPTDRLTDGKIDFAMNTKVGSSIGLSAVIELKDQDATDGVLDTSHPEVSIVWNEDPANLFRAHIYDRETGVLRLYIVARTGGLANVNPTDDGRYTSGHYTGTIVMSDLNIDRLTHEQIEEMNSDGTIFNGYFVTATARGVASVDVAYNRLMSTNLNTSATLRDGGTVHSYDWIEVQPATCVSPARYEYRCIKDDVLAETGPDGEGSPFKTEGEALGHDFQEVVEKRIAPTCTKDGKAFFQCSRCPETKEEVLKATGHKWGAWKVTLEPTCVDEGSQVRECSVCHEKETQKIPATNKHLDADDDKKCDVCGKDLSDSFDNFRCKMCPAYEANKDKPIVGWFYSLVHFFVHFAHWMKHLIKA